MIEGVSTQTVEWVTACIAAGWAIEAAWFHAEKFWKRVTA